jgi:hypothetical protein
MNDTHQLSNRTDLPYQKHSFLVSPPHDLRFAIAKSLEQLASRDIVSSRPLLLPHPLLFEGSSSSFYLLGPVREFVLHD